MQDDAGIVQRLVATWRERRVPLNSGASQAELDDLSRMLGMELPKDIREFYSLANGMPDMSYDDHEVSFWSISKRFVKNMANGMIQSSVSPTS